MVNTLTYFGDGIVKDFWLYYRKILNQWEGMANSQNEAHFANKYDEEICLPNLTVTLANYLKDYYFLTINSDEWNFELSKT